MVNKQKIITMTKLALYDKREGDADRAANGFFRHDYLYRKNLGTRLSVGLGGFLLLAVYWLNAFFMGGAEALTADLQQHAVNSGLFLLALLTAYSLFGTIQGTRQYYLVQKRLDHYLTLLRNLERIEARARRTEAIRREEAGDSEALLYKKPRPRPQGR